MATVHGYAAIGDVEARLRTGEFDLFTTPTVTVVEDIMSKVEDYVIRYTGHAWDAVSIVDEDYYFGGRPRVRLTYDYGETTVDPEIEEAVVLLSCAKLLPLLYEGYPTASGEKTIDTDTKMGKYRAEAMILLNRHKVPLDIRNNQYSPKFNRWIYLNHRKIRAFTPDTHKIEIADLVTNGSWTDIVKSADYEEATTPSHTNKDYYIDYEQGKILFLKSSLIGTRWW